MLKSSLKIPVPRSPWSAQVSSPPTAATDVKRSTSRITSEYKMAGTSSMATSRVVAIEAHLVGSDEQVDARSGLLAERRLEQRTIAIRWHVDIEFRAHVPGIEFFGRHIGAVEIRAHQPVFPAARAAQAGELVLAHQDFGESIGIHSGLALVLRDFVELAKRLAKSAGGFSSRKCVRAIAELPPHRRPADARAAPSARR